ncbi:N-acetylmuramoyl-L-alanine amidase AmiB [Cocleimonas flava]|jgi:N-acetylmuramoyl-L-alanine amidase|uniref:N-acetylmuramoyl-L-alanine amidase AmiC n=1 Tax=Cocleimonas flava TaxID=634765 RepID=A0A4R1F4M9_9GAMM|nr:MULTISPECIES: N-acetylmuramoyl-L-alanine amidase [Cocleimonas]MEB8431517.1 N-acetylmuramoyl-L-alanine amidase [Cocleimonas sp. KMM 6892]MEC4713711.1 N-acetylmuramoyl-L-alanine amidase [Cocleimonas sp. KMM 6895]MEC4743042.1 N-acetylmuramoyl-L-alanine amidase [Cocleimonas sp. KMM 6896]TCJ89197.1 N-acetylmuramoyl-L-alanine amidase [Cocleimonas flava]
MDTTSQKRRDFVLRLGKILGVAGATSVAPHTFAKGRSANIKSVSLKQGAKGSQKLIFELDKSVRHKVSTLKNPDRVVIDFLDTTSLTKLKLNRNTAASKQLINKLRDARRNKNDYRVVLDMAQQAHPSSRMSANNKSFFLEVALSPKQAPKSVEQKTRQAISAVSGGVIRKPIVIAIDAGHGGRDPGAVGKRGTKEKNVALQIAKRLKKQIDRQPGMRGVLIRDGDYYVTLRKRIEKARKNRADLFISIHADANPSRKLTGSSVYILSDKGATSEAARLLAKSENSYETKIAGARLHKNKTLNSIVVGLAQEATTTKSLEIANGVLKELGSVNNLLRSRVESAGFVVLKSPDIPSVLIETAFISNPQEEKRLKTARHQEKLAKAIFKGIRRYQVALQDIDSQYS